MDDGLTQEFRRLLVLEDDETYAPGAEATVTVSLTHERGPGTEVTRTTTVTWRDKRCVDTE